MVLLSSNMVDSQESGKERIEKVLDSGEALNKFQQMIIKQGVKPEVAASLCQLDQRNNNLVLPETRSTTSVRATREGKVLKIDAATVARLAQALGAGRSHPKV